MSVANGQIANASTFNNAFVSRTVDTSTVGKLDLLNSGSATITDTQLVINNILVDLANAEIDIDNLEASRIIKPASSTDNAIVRFDGTSGLQAQNSLVTISDTGSMIIPEDLTVQGNLTVEGTLTSVNSTDLEVEDKNITINKGGSDITAEGAGITVERTGVDGSFIYEDALNSKFKIGALGSEVEVATVSGAQVITNKDIDGGVATNTRRITVPKDTLANLTALTRKAGTVVFATDTLKFYYDNGTTLVESSGGASSAIDVSTGSADAGKVIKTASDGFLSKTFNNTIPSFSSDSAFTTFLGRSAVVGDRYFNTTDKKLYIHDGTAFIVSSGSGSGGVRNFITDGDAEAAVSSIFVPYADAAASRPVDGTGGSPTVTTSITSSSPLDQTKSFLLTKPASNTQGQGWAIPFTVDSVYKTKVSDISVDFIVNSGTFVAGTPTTDSDVIWYIYDVTNSQLIEPSSIKMLSNSTTISDKFSATFQASATGTSYRLIAHCATTSTAAYELKVDNITVSPSVYIYGTPITDWQSFTPTGSWTTNTTYTGFFRRVGDSLEVNLKAQLSGAPNATTLSVNLPPGYSIDTGKLSQITAGTGTLGFGTALDSGVAAYPLYVDYATTTTVAVYVANSTGTYGTNNNVSNTVPITFGAADAVDINFKIPVLGFSSSLQVSDQSDTRVVAEGLTTNAGQTVASGATALINLNVLAFSTHGGADFVTNKRINIIVPGYYDLKGQVTLASGANTGRVTVTIKKNGTGIFQSAVAGNNQGNDSAYVGGVAPLVSGDFIELEVSNDTGGSTTVVSVSSLTFLHAVRISGPAAISANEVIYAKYNTAAGQSINSGASTIVNFGSKIEDSHGSVTTGAAWKFTAQSFGMYNVNAAILFASGTSANTNTFLLEVYKNNTLFDSIGKTSGSGGTNSFGVSGSSLVPMLAGDFIDVRVFQDTGAARTLFSASAVYNKIDIMKIK